MGYFRYKLIEPTGEISSGVISLPYEDEMSASFHLERDEGTLVYVKKLGAIASYLLQKINVLTRKKPSRSLQAEFLSNISIMLRSGMTLTTAMSEAATGINIPGFENDINDMMRRIEGGSSFSEVADKYSYIFPKSIIHLLHMGEETGKLDQMLLDASEHLKRIDTIMSDTKQALLYPTFVFVVMGAGVLFWFYYVVPKIISLFKEMDVTLPTITVVLLNISAFLQNNFFILIVGSVLSVAFLLTSYKGNRKIRHLIDATLLKLPVAGTIISASSLAFITEYFSILIGAGIDIMQSIRILRDSIKNEIYRDKLGVVLQGLERSDTIADSFRNAVIFPSFVVRMINIGEMSGTLDRQLTNIADNYRNKLSLLVATIGKMIEPIVLIIAGVLFAIIIAGLFLPIYALVGQVGGR
jgi:general secretion pathway protein F/type IV pilus assembly protein PilC